MPFAERERSQMTKCQKVLTRNGQRRQKEITDLQISSLVTAVDPANFDVLVAAVKELGQFKETMNMCTKRIPCSKTGLQSSEMCADPPS